MDRARARVSAVRAGGALVLALLLAHCGSFGNDSTSTSAVTGVLCGRSGEHCAVGELCCVSGVGDLACAKDCSTVKFPTGNTSASPFACGQTSDCSGDLECCFRRAQNDCSKPYFASSECVAKGNCPPCPAQANEQGCDPARANECPAGSTCTTKVGGYIWTFCSHP